MKYLIFAEKELLPGIPELKVPGYAVCQECFTPTLEQVLSDMGTDLAPTFDGMVEQLDAAEMRDFGKISDSRPEITEEAPGIKCYKCEREGVAVA